MYMYMHVYVYACICIHICMCVSVSVCLSVCLGKLGIYQYMYYERHMYFVHNQQWVLAKIRGIPRGVTRCIEIHFSILESRRRSRSIGSTFVMHLAVYLTNLLTLQLFIATDVLR